MDVKKSEESGVDTTVDKVSELFGIMGKMKPAERKTYVAKIPPAIRQQLLKHLHLDELKEDKEEKEKKDKKEATKQARARDKRARDVFSAFYRKIKASMEQNLDRYDSSGKPCQRPVFVPFGTDIGTVIAAGKEVESACKFVRDSVEATNGAQEMAFVCGIIQGKRWTDLKKFYDKHVTDFAKVGVNSWYALITRVARQTKLQDVEQFLALYEAWRYFPNISLISCCTIAEFLKHFPKFKVQVEEDRDEDTWMRDKDGNFQWKRIIVFTAEGVNGSVVTVGSYSFDMNYAGKSEAVEEGAEVLRRLAKEDEERKAQLEAQRPPGRTKTSTTKKASKNRMDEGDDEYVDDGVDEDEDDDDDDSFVEVDK